MKLSAQKRYKEAQNKADEMLSKMSLTEKIGQLSQFGTSIYTNDEQHFEDHFAEGKVGSYLTIKGAEKTNHIQKMLLDITRLKIPALFAEDVIHGYKTTAPIPLAQSCTWEPALSLTIPIQARLKWRNFGIFWLVVFERHKAFLHPLHQNLLRNFIHLRSKNFERENFGYIKAKAEQILCVFASILTKIEQKFAFQNRCSKLVASGYGKVLFRLGKGVLCGRYKVDIFTYG